MHAFGERRFDALRFELAVVEPSHRLYLQPSHAAASTPSMLVARSPTPVQWRAGTRSPRTVSKLFSEGCNRGEVCLEPVQQRHVGPHVGLSQPLPHRRRPLPPAELRRDVLEAACLAQRRRLGLDAQRTTHSWPELGHTAPSSTPLCMPLCRCGTVAVWLRGRDVHGGVAQS